MAAADSIDRPITRRERLGRAEQPVGQPDGDGGHQCAGQHAERRPPDSAGRGRGGLVLADDQQHDEGRGAGLDRDERQVHRDVAPAVPADQEDQGAGDDVGQPDRPGRQQQQAEHHRQLGPADQQGLPAHLDLQREQFAGQERGEQDRRAEQQLSRAVRSSSEKLQHRHPQRDGHRRTSALRRPGKPGCRCTCRRGASASGSSIVIANPPPSSGVAFGGVAWRGSRRPGSMFPGHLRSVALLINKWQPVIQLNAHLVASRFRRVTDAIAASIPAGFTPSGGSGTSNSGPLRTEEPAARVLRCGR